MNRQDKPVPGSNRQGMTYKNDSAWIRFNLNDYNCRKGKHDLVFLVFSNVGRCRHCNISIPT